MSSNAKVYSVCGGLLPCLYAFMVLIISIDSVMLHKHIFSGEEPLILHVVNF
jgi:hypothetical protein